MISRIRRWDGDRRRLLARQSNESLCQTPSWHVRQDHDCRWGIAAEPERIATARENSGQLASSIDADAIVLANPIGDRTIAQLRWTKPFSANSLVTVEGLNIIKVSVAPASNDRLELALGRIAAAADALGIIQPFPEDVLVLLMVPVIFHCGLRAKNQPLGCPMGVFFWAFHRWNSGARYRSLRPQPVSPYLTFVGDTHGGTEGRYSRGFG